MAESTSAESAAGVISTENSGPTEVLEIVPVSGQPSQPKSPTNGTGGDGIWHSNLRPVKPSQLLEGFIVRAKANIC